MEPAAFCRSTRVLIVAGKGGVGKTTVTAAVARMAADAGLDTLIVEVEGKSGLATAFGAHESLQYTEQRYADRIRARTLTPDDALVEYLDEHGMRRISRRLARTGALDVVATAAPGIKDILVLGKVKQLERSGDAELIVIDAPAAGHAITFLQSAAALLDAVTVGPIRAQAQDVSELLTDDTRCRVMLVTLPEETPVNEVAETAYALEDRVGIALAPVVVNGLYRHVDGLDADPRAAAAAAGVTLSDDDARALAGAGSFREQRQRLQDEQVGRLAASLPLPQLRLPFMFTDAIGPAEVSLLAAELARAVEALPA